jgi:hypothetical protein
VSAAAAKYLAKIKQVEQEEELKREDRALREEMDGNGGEGEISDDGETFVPAAQRKKQLMSQLAAKRGGRTVTKGEDEIAEDKPVQRMSLLDEKAAMIKAGIVPEEEPDEVVQDHQVMEDLSNKKALMSVHDLAAGVVYTESMKTDWRPPRHIRETTEAERDKLRKKWHIIVIAPAVPSAQSELTPRVSRHGRCCAVADCASSHYRLRVRIFHHRSRTSRTCDSRSRRSTSSCQRGFSVPLRSRCRGSLSACQAVT